MHHSYLAAEYEDWACSNGYQKVEDADTLPQMVVGSSLQLVHMVEPVGFVQVAGTVKAAGTVLVAGTVLLIETQAEESYI